MSDSTGDSEPRAFTDRGVDTGDVTAESSDRRESRVREALEVWKNQLIDLGGRNTLLYFRDQKRGTLDLSDESGIDATSLDSLLQGRTVRFSSLFPPQVGILTQPGLSLRPSCPASTSHTGQSEGQLRRARPADTPAWLGSRALGESKGYRRAGRSGSPAPGATASAWHGWRGLRTNASGRLRDQPHPHSRASCGFRRQVAPASMDALVPNDDRVLDPSSLFVRSRWPRLACPGWRSSNAAF